MKESRERFPELLKCLFFNSEGSSGCDAWRYSLESIKQVFSTLFLIELHRRKKWLEFIEASQDIINWPDAFRQIRLALCSGPYQAAACQI
jgi:hypothetical protein